MQPMGGVRFRVGDCMLRTSQLWSLDQGGDAKRRACSGFPIEIVSFVRMGLPLVSANGVVMDHVSEANYMLCPYSSTVLMVVSTGFS